MSARQYRVAVGTVLASYCEDMTPTFKDLLDFVNANKSDKSFVGHSQEFIIHLLQTHLSSGGLYYEQHLDGRLAGVVLCDFDHEKKIGFVTENLSMSLSRLGRFAAKFRANYPQYSLEAIRHGRHVKFDTEKLYKKLI
jgi:hypothetical protein